MMIALRPMLLTMACLLTIFAGGGCSRKNEEFGRPTMVEPNHDHYHVHAEDVEHEHNHVPFSAGGHRHAHLHPEQSATDASPAAAFE